VSKDISQTMNKDANRDSSTYNRIIMTPGPTTIDERVRLALSRPITNPDLDPDFFDFYRGACQKIAGICATEATVLIMAGEGILGLEAAVASLVEPGEKVLCLANGVFGHGFADFVRMYGGVPVKVEQDFREPLQVKDLEDVLEENPDIRVATMVHCETPSGLLNPIDQLCPYLAAKGVVTIVDAVASVGGDEVRTDEWGIDVLLGGSQKAFSAPPGLTFMAISQQAWQKVANRETPVPGFYLNLAKWREMWLEKGYFPYTQSVSDIYALDEASNLILQDLPGTLERHRRLGDAVRSALTANGLDLYPSSNHANTVTAFLIPNGIDDEGFRRRLWQNHGVMIAGSWGELAGKVWRIGHMGFNASEERLLATFAAMDVLLGLYGRDTELVREFARALR